MPQRAKIVAALIPLFTNDTNVLICVDSITTDLCLCSFGGPPVSSCFWGIKHWDAILLRKKKQLWLYLGNKIKFSHTDTFQYYTGYARHHKLC